MQCLQRFYYLKFDTTDIKCFTVDSLNLLGSKDGPTRRTNARNIYGYQMSQARENRGPTGTRR